MQEDLAVLQQLEQELTEAVAGFRLLTALAWPRPVVEQFLATWRAGKPELPRPVYALPDDLTGLMRTVERVMERTPQDHPVGRLVWRTAWSYLTAARMLASVGTPAFTERSIELYGRPDRNRVTQEWSDLDAAEFLLDKTSEMLASCAVPGVVRTMPAADLAAALEARIAPLFAADPIEVQLAPELSSRAAASSERVRLREGALFSPLDLDQLFEHEVMVHAATMLNGRRQPHVTVLGLAAPRTTRHQEGLATLAEILTGSMDLVRLRRIALRVRAIAMALDGADFIDVFRMFLDEGQDEEDSAHSAMRIFRGGDPGGGALFTKDGVYIGGLIEVHSFMRVAVRDGRPELIPHLFSGRLTLRDVIELAPAYDAGVLVGPHYVPSWAADMRRLTALMSFSAFTNMIDLDPVHLDLFVHSERKAIGRSLVAGEDAGRKSDTASGAAE